MKRFSTQFFLLLCTLLLTAYSQWYMGYHREHLHRPPVRLVESAAFAYCDNSDGLTWIYAAPSSDQDHLVLLAEANEEKEEVEEDEDEQDHRFSASKKSFGSNYYLLAALTQSFSDSFTFGKGTLPVSQQYSNISSCKRYLVFQTFRI